MIVAMIALFVALGGTSYAGVTLGANVVRSGNIKNGEVKKKDIAKNAVRSGKIKNGAVKEADLKDAAVSSKKVKDGAVTSSKVADGGVTSSKLADAGVTSSKIAAGAVTGEKVSDGAVTPSKVGTTPATRAYHSGAQSIPSGSGFTPLAMDSERFDTTDMHDPVTNNSRITAASAGIYLVGAHITWLPVAAGARELDIRKNGTTIVARVVQLGDPTNTVDQSLTTLLSLAAGDYVEVVVRQTSGAPLGIPSTAEYSPEFWATWMGPA